MDFMRISVQKPLRHQPGNGFHINISVKRRKTVEDPLSLWLLVFWLFQLTVFLNPTVASYERFGGPKAPGCIPGQIRTALSLFVFLLPVDAYRRAELRSQTPRPIHIWHLLFWSTPDWMASSKNTVACALRTWTCCSWCGYFGWFARDCHWHYGKRQRINGQQFLCILLSAKNHRADIL